MTQGVWFKKCFLIVWQGMLEVPEEILSTVRLSLTSRELPEENIKVRVGLLLYARQGDTENIMHVTERIHYFNSQDRVLNIDNVVPFEDLNPSAAGVGDRNSSPYLIGPQKDKLKINVVITPVMPVGGTLSEDGSHCSLLL